MPAEDLRSASCRTQRERVQTLVHLKSQVHFCRKRSQPPRRNLMQFFCLWPDDKVSVRVPQSPKYGRSNRGLVIPTIRTPRSFIVPASGDESRGQRPSFTVPRRICRWGRVAFADDRRLSPRMMYPNFAERYNSTEHGCTRSSVGKSGGFLRLFGRFSERPQNAGNPLLNAYFERSCFGLPDPV